MVRRRQRAACGWILTDSLIKGGSDGPVVNTTAPDASELLRRLNLPATDEKHMPPAGRPSLTADQIALLTWWIKEGAPEKQTLSELKTPPEIMHILSNQLPPAAGAQATSATAATGAAAGAPETTDTGDKVVPVTSGSLPPLPKGIPGRLEAIVANGPDLEYSAGYHFAEVDDAQFNKLAAVASHIIWLDLARSRVTDEGLHLVAKMNHLQKLELQDTKTTDAVLESVASLDQLQVLNLNGTKITDAGLPQLAKIKTLQHLYLYDTAVTDAGEKSLKLLLPQLDITRQLPPAIAPITAVHQAMPAPVAKTGAVPPPGNETVWVDDALPPGASTKGDQNNWNFVAANPAPYAGAKCWTIGASAGSHQVYFVDAPSLGATRKTLYTYVYLDPNQLPMEVMLQWHDTTGSWNHRAYWGKDNLLKSFGAAVKIGELPPAGKWTRLEVPAASVGLVGAALNGLAFSLYGGGAAFDLAGTTELNVPISPATQSPSLSPVKP